jgi:hypothetical protein
MKTLLRTILLIVLGFVVQASAQDDAVLRAMKDEMARSLTGLHLSDLARPYFIAYRVSDYKTTNVAASLGSLTTSDVNNSRLLTVEVRTGSYSLDNTNYIPAREFSSRMAHVLGGTQSLALDDDYRQIRRSLWLATDSEYKKSAEEFVAKKSILQNRKETAVLADYTMQPALQSLEPRSKLKVDITALESLARELSAIFKSSPDIFSSQVTIIVNEEYVRYINSEGSVCIGNNPLVRVDVSASTQAVDGMPLNDEITVFGKSMDALEKTALTERVKAMSMRLSDLRNAKSIDRYSGPVLFEGEAAGQLVAQVFATAINASRFPTSDEPQFEEGLRQAITQLGGESLADRLGARVMPEWLDVVDKPNAESADGVPLLGGSKIDLEAVPTHDSVVVDHGILKQLLATRTPSSDGSSTTGSAHGVGATPTNLFLLSRKSVSEIELRKEALQVAKQRGLGYVIVVRDIGETGLSWTRRAGALAGAAGASMGNGGGLGIYRLFDDGHEEIVRGVEFGPISASSLRDILAAGGKTTVHTTQFVPMLGAIVSVAGQGAMHASMEHLTSYVTPSLLIDDIVLKRTTTATPNGPIVSSPLTTTSEKRPLP